ncbi:hypothetical protein HanPI659440_Chr15g0610191 [Helianthus annuus]|nr:hypothetical protein HanPI659440_Chr15g0610191 [Helianthus annuus]
MFAPNRLGGSLEYTLISFIHCFRCLFEIEPTPLLNFLHSMPIVYSKQSIVLECLFFLSIAFALTPFSVINRATFITFNHLLFHNISLNSFELVVIY